ncbi:MAG TPA: helix-turn-helix domain-containing protein [Bdellovibrio sp.]|uniref:winged helix-turn-helix transcriptional regulator n=1 Tax=Bdellovibrio sp. TaxID=28201 RepID=UPI002F0BC9CF
MKEKGKRKQLPSLEGCKSERSLATKEFISRIGDKWSIMIVLALSRHEDSRARFSDLKKGIVGISQTMLTSTLRGLERDGIVEREVFPEIPPRVEYQLTKLGLSVLEPMKVLTEWTMINWDSVKRARAKYDSKL